MKKKLLAGSAIIIFMVTWTGIAEASFAITHSGATDPITEGFGVWPYVGGTSTVEPVYGDLGYDAWSITGLTPNQYAYYSEPLSPSQQVDIINQGYVLTLVERGLKGVAPAYSTDNPVVVSATAISIGGQRFDIDIGVNSNGETIVVLPDYIASSGGYLITPGASYTVADSGSSYHTYQLVYDPTTQLADLFVDNIVRIHDYAGFSYQSSAEGNSRGFYSLLWGGVNGGQANFSSVQFASSPVPLPGAAWLFGSALVGLISFTRCKSQDS